MVSNVLRSCIGSATALSCIALLAYHSNGESRSFLRRVLSASAGGPVDVYNYTDKGKSYMMGIETYTQSGVENDNGADYSTESVYAEISAAENRYRESSAVTTPPNAAMAPNPELKLNFRVSRKTGRFSVADKRMYITTEDARLPTERGYLVKISPANIKITPSTMDGSLSITYTPPYGTYSRSAYYCTWSGVSGVSADCSAPVVTESVNIDKVTSVTLKASFDCQVKPVKNPPLYVFTDCQDTCDFDPITYQCIPNTYKTVCSKYQDRVLGTTCTQGVGTVSISIQGGLVYTHTFPADLVPDYSNYIMTAISDNLHVSKYTTTPTPSP